MGTTPTIVEPKSAWETISSLCSSGHTPQIMTGVIYRILVTKFSTERNIENPMLKHLIWTNDFKTTKIQIQPLWFFNVKDIQRRPGIYIKRNRVIPQRIAINDGTMIDLRNAGEIHSMNHVGSHTIGCCGGGPDAGEVDGIASEVYRELCVFAPLIRKDCDLMRVQVSGCSEISKIEESKENYVCRIVINWAYSETYILTPEGTPPKTISLHGEPIM